jgi:phosphatidylinositol alpha-mannosyltransferase
MMTVDQRRAHRIVQVSAFYPPRLGGVETVTKQLAEHLADHNDVAVYTTSFESGSTAHECVENGVRVLRFRAFVLANAPISPGFAWRLLTLSRRCIVHVHIATAFVPEVVMLTSLLRRRPYVAHFHMDFGPSGRFGRLLKHYKRYVLSRVLRHAARVIVLYDGQANFVAGRYGVARDRIAVVPNGVDAAFNIAEQRRRDARDITAALRILFVGRLEPDKNPARLLDAVSCVSADVEVVIVGDGGLRCDIAARISALGLSNVRLVGPARGDDLVQWYRWADVFVLPSDNEGMPLVLLDAMAAGLAIIATDIPGTRNTLGDAGVLTEQSCVAIAKAIENVATDREFLHDLSRRSATRSEKFQWRESVKKLDEIYDGLLELTG